jgi:hypothetical protein
LPATIKHTTTKPSRSALLILIVASFSPRSSRYSRRFGLVLVTHNWKHFRRIARELELGSAGTNAEVQALSRIDMEIHQSEGPRRMAEALPLIEAEWRRREGFGIQVSICKRIVRVHQ